ncbi:ER retention sequence binding [Fragilaria crotonensis]|nr:ER retention sequence binding [Fragilaria crotonensis]
MAAVKPWHYVIATILTFGAACFLSDNKHGTDPVQIFKAASSLWEPLALVPQAVLYRRYRQIEGLTGASFLFLMGLYRLLYMVNWIVSAKTEEWLNHTLLDYLGGGAQALIASYALFWAEHTIFQFRREVYCGMLGLLLLFGLIFCVKIIDRDKDFAAFVNLVTSVGFALIALALPASFLYSYCNNTRASAQVGSDTELTLPLVNPTSEGVECNDTTKLALLSDPSH